MPYEIKVDAIISGIATEEEASELRNQISELILTTITKVTPHSNDLVVGGGHIVEYDKDSCEVTRVIWPPELPSEEVQQGARTDGSTTVKRVTCSHCGGQVRLAPDGRTMFHGDAKTLQGDCLGSRELPSEEVQQRIRTGVDQAHRGETRDLGSFTQYADED